MDKINIDPISSLNDFCRACTQQNVLIDMKSLFCANNLLEVYRICTSLEVQEQDGLPTHICDKCFNLIMNFKEFRLMCSTSDNYFREKINVKTEPDNITNELYHQSVDVKVELLPVIENIGRIRNKKLSSYNDNNNLSTVDTILLENNINKLDIKKESVDQNVDFNLLNDNSNNSTAVNIKKTPSFNLDHNDDEDDDDDDNNNNEDDNDVGSDKDDDSDKEFNTIVDFKDDNKKPKTKGKKKDTRIRIRNRKTETKLEKFICDQCNRKFYKKHRLEAHLRQHQGLKPCLCKKCGKSFSKWCDLKQHIKIKHNNGSLPKFICEYPNCDKTYNIKQSLAAHIKRIHTEKPADMVPPPRSICELCGKSFRTTSQLKKHSYTHTGLMPYKCHLCPKKYPTNHKLKEHIMRHQGIKNHVCSICGLRKITPHELKIHMNYHTREKLYNCKYCSSVFTSTGNMSGHIKIVHCGIKAHSCPHCNRSFGKSSDLKHHVMTHTGEKPHACIHCGKRFIQHIALRTHMKIHTRTLNKLPSTATPSSVVPVLQQ